MQEKPRKWCYELGSYTTDFSWHVNAAPLVHISSAYISTNFDDGSCEVYGSIRAIDGENNSFDLYDMDITDCKTISKCGALLLTGPQDHPILGFKGVTIEVSLKDRTRNIELVKGCFHLDCVSTGSYNRLLKVGFQGEHGCLYLYYTTFEFAISAILEVALVKKGDMTLGDDRVFGSLTACYGKNEHHCRSDEVKYLKTALFEKPSHEALRVMLGTPFKLLRHLVVVPAYSSLVIDVELVCSQGRFTKIEVEFPVDDGADLTAHIPCEKGCIELQVTVEWRNAFPHIYNAIPKAPVAIAESLKRARVLSHQQLTPCSPQMSDVALNFRGSYGVEIFSVYVSSINYEVSTLSGTIIVDDCPVPVLVYDKKMEDPGVLPDDKFVSIELHSPLKRHQCLVQVNLNGPDEMHNISNGQIDWGYGMIESHGMSWDHKRICSVVRGKVGYAIFHYMIFTSAIKATVEVNFFCDNITSVRYKLYGDLSVRYAGHEYHTEYDRKYYQSRLFRKPLSQAVEQSPGSRVPLSKSVVVLPKTSHLIVEADLKAICDDNLHEEVMYGIEEFMIDLSGPTCKKFQGKSCRIEVSIQYGENMY